MKLEHNAALYRKLNVPIPDNDAKVAAQAFFEEVATAREKHGIADIVVICRVTIANPDNTEYISIASGSCGNTHNVAPMLAYTLGRTVENNQRNLERLVVTK
jgi:hypothetical protein